jgi:hypothetical protein
MVWMSNMPCATLGESKGRAPGMHYVGCWVAPRGGLGDMEKSERKLISFSHWVDSVQRREFLVSVL